MKTVIHAEVPLSLLFPLLFPKRAQRMWGPAPSGSRSGFFVRSPSVRGREMDDPVAAFDEVAVDFLGDHYWLFFNDDPTRPSEEWAGPTEDVGELIRAHWDALGLRQRPVFVLHHLQLPAERRGQGKGREAYEALERKVAQAGIGAIILQAGMLDDAWRHSLGFWRKMGFEEWPGDYWIFPDRIMVKVLP